MGATPSKKRKERRRQKETEEVLAAVANLKEVYTQSSFHPYRRSQLLDFHDASAIRQGEASDDVWWQKSASTGAVNLVVPNTKKGIANGSKQRLTFSQVNVDNHPVLSSLQNKQNARLENMEYRLGEIRRHALEAVAAQQRRVQGHNCQGQTCPKQTFQGQNVTNGSLDEKMAMKAAADNVACERHSELPGAINCSDEDDEGEVIPVRVLTSAESRRAEMRRQRREFSREKSPADPLSLDLLWKGSPLIIALLPIILPVLLLSVIMKAISQSYQDKKKR